MAELDGLCSNLETMSFTELVLAFVALIAYTLALNGSFSARCRSLAGALALAAAAAFAACMSQWIEGVMLMALVIVAMGLFVGLAWLLSAVCGLTGRTGMPPPAETLALAGNEAAMALDPAPALALRPRNSHPHLV